MIYVSASIEAANQAASTIPIKTTTPSLLFTTPSQTISTNGAIKQLPPQVISAMINQQAVNNVSLSEEKKKQFGILPSSIGPTFNQLSLPGQAIKPGAGEFIQSLQNSAPSLSLNQTASKVLMSGANGVKNSASLVASTSAQIGAVSSSIQNATTGLVKNGTISQSSLQQSSGVIFAAATVGVSVVTAALKNPGSVSAAVSGIKNSSFGQLVTSGNFAAGLADKDSSGVSGLANSISGVASGAIGSLSKGITGLVDKFKGAAGGIQTGINSLIDSLASTAQNAFKMAEASFGTLKAGVPNTLGKKDPSDEQLEKLSDLNRKFFKAHDEFNIALKQANEAKRKYEENPTEENLTALQAARKNMDEKFDASQKLLVESREQEKITFGGNSPTGVSAQSATTTAATIQSGVKNMPTSLNTGLNALPGGSSLYANQVKAGESSLFNTSKKLSNSGLASVGGTVAALSDPSKLVGNLVENVSGTLTNNLTNSATNLNSAIGNVTSISDSLKTKATGLSSGLLGALDSIGNGPIIKIPTLATNTFADTATINSKIGQCLGDSRVPPPVFEEPPAEDIDANEYLLAQSEAQTKINDYKFDRELLTYRLDSAIEEYNKENDPEILAQIDDWQNQLDVLDSLITQAQENYNNIVTYT